MQSDPLKPQYFVSMGKSLRKVSPERLKLAQKIDKNKDKVISDKELVDYLSKKSRHDIISTLHCKAPEKRCCLFRRRGIHIQTRSQFQSSTL